MPQAASALAAAAVLLSGVLACFATPSAELLDDPSEIWRSMPIFYGGLDLLIGLAVLVWTISPNRLLSPRSQVKWKGGAYGARPPSNAGFIWNPVSLLMAGLCLGSLGIAPLAGISMLTSLSTPSAWPKALLALAHLYVAILLFRATRQVLNAATE